MITFDDFKKIDIRIGKILEVSKIDGSDKLIKLAVDIGEETRQVIAGIGKKYEPDFLIGKQVVVLVNLEYRQLMGLESQGMILSAHDENNRPVLIMPCEEVISGSQLS